REQQPAARRLQALRAPGQREQRLGPHTVERREGLEHRQFFRAPGEQHDSATYGSRRIASAMQLTLRRRERSLPDARRTHGADPSPYESAAHSPRATHAAYQVLRRSRRLTEPLGVTMGAMRVPALEERQELLFVIRALVALENAGRLRGEHHALGRDDPKVRRTICARQLLEELLVVILIAD